MKKQYFSLAFRRNLLAIILLLFCSFFLGSSLFYMICWKKEMAMIRSGYIIRWHSQFWNPLSYWTNPQDDMGFASLWEFIECATPFQRFIGQLGLGATLFFVLDVGRRKLRLQLPEKAMGLLILAAYLLSMFFLLAGRPTILGWKLGDYLDKALPFDAAAFSTYYLLGKLFRDTEPDGLRENRRFLKRGRGARSGQPEKRVKASEPVHADPLGNT